MGAKKGINYLGLCKLMGDERLLDGDNWIIVPWILTLLVLFVDSSQLMKPISLVES